MRNKTRPEGEGRLIQGVYYGYVAGSAVVRAIPERAAYALARGLGAVWFRLGRGRRAVVERNISRITGEPPSSPRVKELTIEAFKSYALYWLETFRLVRESKEFFLERFHCANSENIDKIMARGKGAIVVVGHLGNWDAAGAWVGASGRRLVTVAELLKPRRMFDFFADHRARLGMTIHPATRGAIEALSSAVEAGAVVAILGDRDLKGRGPEVTFFGERATLPAGPAVVALRTGVPLLVAGVYGVRMPDGRRGWEAEISDIIELPDEPGEDAVQELTAEVARRLEGYVARRPEEWHVFQPFWPVDREGDARA